jgi:predicted TIM-barrel fold metal-dependent hydrolase
MEEPPVPAHFTQMLNHLGMNDRILFATDYPHWDFDAPDQAFPVKIEPALKQEILSENARRLYRL